MEEYDFSDEELEEDDGCDTAHYRDPNGAMMVPDSDDDEPEDSWQQNYRPWNAGDGFTKEARQAWETMFATFVNHPMGPEKDWNTTEAYMREKDKEMVRYEGILKPFHFSS